MQDDRWFLRKSGKVTGPFNRVQLDGLRRRGQLSQFHEASQDRQNWSAATTIPGLFPETGSHFGQGGGQGSVQDSGGYSMQAEPTGNTSYSPPLALRQEWHYNDATATVGPVGADQISSLIASGRIHAETPVWREGLATWILIKETPEFAALVSKPQPMGELGLESLEFDQGNQATRSGKTSFANPLLIGLVALGLVAVAGVGVFVLTQNPDFSQSLALTQHINSHDREDIRKAVGLVLWGRKETNRKTGVVHEIPSIRGSCFQVSPDGYLLTNKHVVEAYQEFTRADAYLKEQFDNGITIEPKLWVFFENEKYDAKVIHTSGKFDLAVLKVDYKDNNNKPYFQLKAKPNVRQTTQVYALGFPAAVSTDLSHGGEKKKVTRELSEHVESSLGESDFRYSITAGIVSLVRTESNIEYIMHGAQISGGNSGGPLIGQDGSVFGINTLKTGVKDDVGIVTNYYAVGFSQMLEELRKQVPSMFK